MAGVLKHFVDNSSSPQLLHLLSCYLETPTPKRDSDLYLSLKEILTVLHECDELSQPLVCRTSRELCLPEIRQSLVDRHKLHTVYEVIALCCAVGPEGLVREWIALCLEGLSNHAKEIATPDGLPVVVCLDLCSYLMRDEAKIFLSEELQQQLFDCLLRVMQNSDELLCAKITSCVMPLFLSTVAKVGQQRLHTLWTMIKEISGADHVDNHLNTHYAMMCSLVDFFITDSKSKNNLDTPDQSVLCDPVFWEIIQQGLKTHDPISYKRAMYLLKRALDYIDKSDISLEVKDQNNTVLFYWSQQQKKYWVEIWQEIVLFLETLEGTQVHVIKPVLPRISRIISATEFTKEGYQALNISWLMTVFQKASLHPNKFIRKWAVLEILTIDLSKSPLLLPTNWQFLTEGFLTMINEYNLYGKDYDGIPESASAVGIALHSFYKLCLEFLPKEQHVHFLTNLLTSIEREKLSSVPVLFVFHGLANMPCLPVLGAELLHKISNILLQLRTHQTHLRIATKGFVVITVAKLTDPTLVGWDVIYSFLATETLEECLQRNSNVWKNLCECLWKIETERRCIEDTSNSLSSKLDNGLLHFLEMKMERFLNEPDNAKNADQVEALGRIILAAADTYHTNQPQPPRHGSPLVPILNKILHIFQDACTRLYMSEAKLCKAVTLLTSILQVLSCDTSVSNRTNMNGHVSFGLSSQESDSTKELVEKSLQQTLEDILNLLQRKLTLCEGPCIAANPYLQLCKALHNFYTHTSSSSLNSSWVNLGLFVENTTKSSLKVVQRLQENECFGPGEWALLQQAMLFISWACEITCEANISAGLSELLVDGIPSFRLNVEFKKPDTTFGDWARSTSSWGKSVSGYIGAMWTAVEFFFRRTKTKPESDDKKGVVSVTSHPKDVLAAALDALDIVTSLDGLPIISSIALLIAQLGERDEDSCCRALDVVWSLLLETWDRTTFWEVYHASSTVLFSPTSLMRPEGHPLTVKVKSYFEKLLSEGEERPGVVNVFTRQLVGVWATNPVECHGSLSVHQGIVIEGLMYGPNIKKSQQTEVYVVSHLRNLGNQSILCTFDMRDDRQVRVAMVNALLALDAMDKCNLALIKDIIRGLLTQDEQISSTKIPVYTNSQGHRRKHRAWQAILMLLPLVLEHDTDNKYAEEMLKVIFASLLDTNQISVQNYQQWIVLRILTRFPDMTSLLWRELLLDCNKRVGRVSCLSTIAMLLSLHCAPDPTQRTRLLTRAISAVFPWVSANHRGVRVSAQVAVQRMWHCCVVEDLDTVLKDDALLGSFLSHTLAANDTLAEKVRLLENYFFFDFNPIRDFSVESIYHTIPKHSGVIDEEWVAPEEFRDTPLGMRTWKSSRCQGIPLYNEDRSLADFNVEPYHYKEKAGVHFEHRFRGEKMPRKVKTSGTESNQEINNSVAGDVQKKIIAWKIVPPEEVMMAELQQQRMLSLQKSSGGNLVVVASLIDKAPNLGGLCRTSEIFGVRKLVLGSSDIMKDHNFKSLSVSSAKWIDVDQVRPAELKDYLQDMRRQGYTLIGVEQTANSRPLTQYRFPHDALLLLGNEKEGIPADLIQLLDECVEIPQVGIIRSLNVHVSGALLIWEYTRQRMLSGNSTAE